jgi:DNA-binding beta-propeller fold protein YncE
VDGQGQVYVANTGNDRIDVFNRSGAPVRSFGTSGRGTGQFNTPSGVAADAQGYRAVTDAVNGRVEIFAPDGSIVTTWGSPAPGPTVLPRPVALAFDANGNAYVLDQRRARIVVFDRQTGLPTRSMATQGSEPGQLLDPSALAISPGGTIWVADTGNERLARFALDGTFLGSIPDSGAVRGVAISPDGLRVYTTDAQSRIAVLSPEGNLIDEFGGRGTKLGKLDAPGQLTVDGAGNLWVADRGNSRIQQFGPNGERLATFGTRGTGPGQFINPTGVSVDCNGLLTVTDTANNRVQQFALAAPAAAGTCVPLAPLGTPAPPKLPTLPVPDGPQVTLRALRTSGLVSSRTLPLRAGCDTTCRLEVEVRIAPRARPAKGRKLVTIKLTTTASIAAGDTAVVRLRLSDRQARSLTRALRGRRGLQADVQVVATASVGQPTTVTQRLSATS